MRAFGGQYLPIPRGSLASVDEQEDLIRVLTLVHLGGNDVHGSVAVEVRGRQAMNDAFDPVHEDVLHPAGLLGIGRGLKPREPMPIACQFRRRQHNIRSTIAVDIGDLDASTGVPVAELVCQPCTAEDAPIVLKPYPAGNHVRIAIAVHVAQG